jgi:hypothetical protein
MMMMMMMLSMMWGDDEDRNLIQVRLSKQHVRLTLSVSRLLLVCL